MTTKIAEPSASMAAGNFIGTGTLLILAALGIFTTVLILVSPVFTIIAYVLIAAAVVFYFGKGITQKNPYRPIYLLCSFFGLVALMIAAPVFMSFFPATTFATTGQAALAQATAGVGASNPQMALTIMPVIAAGTIASIAAGRAKKNIQLIGLSIVAVLISIVVMITLLVV